jgi:hypothetical protein
VDRVLGVELLDDVFVPPADLDPVASVEAHLATGWKFEVEILVDGRLPGLPPALGRAEILADGTTRLVGTTDNPSWYAEQLVRIPAPYRIVKCPELRAAARALGERLLAAATA